MSRISSFLGFGSLALALFSTACGDGDDPISERSLGREIHIVPDSRATRPDGSEARPFATLPEALTAIESDGAWQGTIVASKGRHELPFDLELPKGADLRVHAGATFAIGAGAGLHAQGDVKVLGTPAEPVTFTWLTEGSAWGSLTNFEPTSTENVFEYAIFEHASHSQWGAVHVRGALSLEGASGRISHCIFRLNQGDDGLSLGRSATKVEYSVFEQNFGDAMDIDGAPENGRTEVVNCTFREDANDAIDLGENSTALIHFNEIWRAGDKGVSIGEASTPIIENNLIVGCDLGIAIKDGSDPQIRNNTLYANGVGVTAYEAVSGFGSGKGSFTNGIIWGSEDADVDIGLGSTAFSYSCIGTSRNSADEVDPELVVNGFEGEGNTTVGAGCDDPRFANPDAEDFHLQSRAGRWDSEAADWVSDEESSPCIDAGDPLSDVGSETQPNGSRVNLGYYGGTGEASRSDG